VSEPEKPRPKVRARTVHELRQAVIARHKMLASTKPYEEAKQLIQDEYGADDDSCRAFIAWLRGDEPESPPSKNTTIERVHVSTDPETGDERYVET
jgi:hypothetical protein